MSLEDPGGRLEMKPGVETAYLADGKNRQQSEDQNETELIRG